LRPAAVPAGTESERLKIVQAKVFDSDSGGDDVKVNFSSKNSRKENAFAVFLSGINSLFA